MEPVGFWEGILLNPSELADEVSSFNLLLGAEENPVRGAYCFGNSIELLSLKDTSPRCLFHLSSNLINCAYTMGGFEEVPVSITSIVLTVLQERDKHELILELAGTAIRPVTNTVNCKWQSGFPNPFLKGGVREPDTAHKTYLNQLGHQDPRA